MSWEKWHSVFLKEMEAQLEIAQNVSSVHKRDHIERVWITSRKICEKLGGDLEVMAAAVMLHDLGRHQGLEIHGEKSAELAKPILEKHNFPKEKIPKVLEAIAQHDYTFPAEKRKLLESKILYDADKIDAFGVVGVYRHVLFLEDGRIKIEEVLDLLEKRWDGLSLPESKEIAKDDYEYIVNFFKKLLVELGVEE